ncbi:MAG: PEP-utilizing enzyme [Acidobacteriota bacterium]
MMASPPGNQEQAAMGPGSARFLFRSFKRILACNTAALEGMARMDRALGGEYVFDAAYLESAVREVCRLTHLSAYHINGMADETYVGLYDTYLSVKDALEDILAGGMGPLAGRRVLPFAEIGWELEPLVGLCSVGLAVLGRRMGLPAPDGLAITVTGMADLSAQAAPTGDAYGAAQAEVEAGVAALFAHLGGPGPLELTCVAAGTDGAGTILATAFADSVEAAGQAAARLAREYGRDREVAVCLRPRLGGEVAGTLQTLAHDPNLPPAMLAVAWPEAAPGLMDRCWLSRTAPHGPLRTRLAAKPLEMPLPGGAPLTRLRGRSLRGSGLLAPDRAAELAELGLAAERALGGPCLLSWVLADDGGFRLTGLEPAETAYPDWVEEADAAQAAPNDADLLLSGGQIACGGVGAGPVVPLDDDTSVESVPLGSVGVARTASPALSRIVPRLGALLAEVGTPASHLATVARENRVPAVFGLKGAAALEAGALVTVDAEQTAVYRGVVESLLRQAAMQGAQVGSEPEYLVLRRLQRHIRPLHLVDPKARDFDPEHCLTCHDILHFAHEKAVELLLTIDASQRGGLGAPRRLREDSPFALRIVDVGGGLAGEGDDVALAEVTSLPLRAFLEGLLLRDAKRPGPARLNLGDIMAGMTRSTRALEAAPETVGANLALAAADYANITLRLGYHFSVVDAVVSERPEHNFIYFRFAGGFADGDRRARRAGLLLTVLERLGFRATRQGDLVVGKRKLLEAGEALEVLRFLGALSAYTRQLDVELADEEDVARFARQFLELCGLGSAEGHTGESA